MLCRPQNWKVTYSDPQLKISFSELISSLGEDAPEVGFVPDISRARRPRWAGWGLPGELWAGKFKQGSGDPSAFLPQSAPSPCPKQLLCMPPWLVLATFCWTSAACVDKQTLSWFQLCFSCLQIQRIILPCNSTELHCVLLRLESKFSSHQAAEQPMSIELHQDFSQSDLQLFLSKVSCCPCYIFIKNGES